MRKLVWVFAPLLFAALPVSAEIFKCAGKTGLVVYQNFQCEVDSLGSVASTATKAAATVPQTKPTGSPAPVVERVTEPRVGMRAEEVRAIWGDPTDRTT